MTEINEKYIQSLNAGNIQEALNCLILGAQSNNNAGQLLKLIVYSGKTSDFKIALKCIASTSCVDVNIRGVMTDMYYKEKLGMLKLLIKSPYVCKHIPMSDFGLCLIGRQHTNHEIKMAKTLVFYLISTNQLFGVVEAVHQKFPSHKSLTGVAGAFDSDEKTKIIGWILNLPPNQQGLILQKMDNAEMNALTEKHQILQEMDPKVFVSPLTPKVKKM